MYPTSVTFWPLAWALVIGALCMGFSMSAGSIKPLKAFAASYDRHYLPMLLNKGRLSIIKPTGKTALVPLNVPTSVETVIADPSLVGKSKVTTYPLIVLFNQNSVVLTGSAWSSPWVLSPMVQLQRELLALNTVLTPSAANSTPINKLPSIRVDSKTLPALMPLISVLVGLASVPAFFLAFSAWILLMIFLTGFLVMSINRNLGMPLKAAWRISMAVMIPVLVLRGMLAIFGVVPAINDSPMTNKIIYMVPIGLALWAAILANRMFSKQLRGKP